MKIKDLTGQIFGQWLITSYAPEHIMNNGRKIAYWNCLCTCGKEKIVNGTSLRMGRSTSCGCYVRKLLSHNNIDDIKLSSAKRLFAGKYSDGNLNFNIFVELIQQNCFYCNLDSHNSNKCNFFSYINTKDGIKYKHSDFAVKNGDYHYNGLDRINSNEKHNINNCVPCCAMCNYFKLDLKINDFLNNINCLQYSFDLITADKLDVIRKKLTEQNETKICKICTHRSSRGINTIITKISAQKESAKTRGLQFELTQLECAELLCASCNYCNKSASPHIGVYNGIDRIDSNVGYLLNNCVSCCKYCNYAKSNYTLEEFISWIKRIKDYYLCLQKKIKIDKRFSI
jgi:hypothetical protein